MKLTFQLYWGVLLIIGGLAALAQSFGYADRLSPEVALVAFAIASLLALVGYWQSGWRDWGWVFPFGIFGGLAITTGLARANANGAGVATPIFLGLLLPFGVAYLTDRARNWWALIPGSVMLMLALVTAFVDSTNNDVWIGSLVLFMLAFGFLAVFLNNQRHTWAALVAWILGALGIAPLMTSLGTFAAYYGVVVFLAIGIPFLFVYWRAPEKRWWAIIPAGVMATLALMTVVALSGWIRSMNEGGYVNALLMGGLAATFAVIWVRHDKAWAKIVALVLALIALFSILFVASYQLAFPVAIMLAGGYLLWTALRPKTV